MPGQYVLIRDRWSYFPDFQNERLTGHFVDSDGRQLGGPPYWSCTFTALMYGINFAFLGQKPTEISQREIVGLALDSGDDDLRGGGTTSLMQKALTKRYGKPKDQEKSGPKRIQERLAAGEMLVAGIRSTDLSDHFRRYIGNSGALHRAGFIGLRIVNGKAQTRMLDPMAVPSSMHYPNPRSYAGEWFPMDDYFRAAFSDQQLWFQPGEFLDRVPLHVRSRFSPPRTLTVAAGTTLVGFDRRRPERKVLQTKLGQTTKMKFDIHLHATVGGVDRELLSIADGPFDGLLVQRHQAGLTANTDIAVPVEAEVILPDLPIVELPDDPTDVVPPGREAPGDTRSGPVDLVLDDDPLEMDRPDEDATAEPAM